MQTTSNQTGRTCTKCKKWKPVESYGPSPHGPDGLKRWCRDCENIYRSTWKKTNRDAHRAHKELYERFDKGTMDALTYSRSVCAHVETYIQKRIQAFEKKTGMDAPPHLVAILEVAHSAVASHPTRRKKRLALRDVLVEATEYGRRVYIHPQTGQRYIAKGMSGDYDKAHLRHCDDCGAPVGWRTPRTFFAFYTRCPDCIETAKAQTQVRQAARDQKPDPFVTARRTIGRIRADLAAIYRLNGTPWVEIANKLGFSGPGHAHNAVYGGDARTYAPLRQGPVFKPK